MKETWVQSLGWEDPLEKGKAAAAAAKSLQSYPTLLDPIDGCPPGSPVHGVLWVRTEVGGHFLLQDIFLIQGLNPGLLHCRQILYHLSHQRLLW